MVDAEPHLPRQFDGPDPPQKPPYIFEKRWSKFSSRLTAKLKSNKTGFDVRLSVFSNSTAYKLGPPSKVPDYPHHVEKYGLQVLEAAGFLNHKDEGMSGKINGRCAFEAWRNPSHSPDLQKRIHHVWRWQQWAGITPHQYSLMTPALLLASAILDDPVTLSYFYALAMPSDSMDTVSHATKGLTADCKVLKIPDVLPDGEVWGTSLNVDLMAIYIRDWGFDKNLEGAYGYTAKYKDSNGNYPKGSKPNTFSTYVRLQSSFMDILEYFEAGQKSDDDRYSRIFDDLQTMAGIPSTHRAPISHASAIYRTYFVLAQTLLHEFAHAFSLAYFERRETDNGPCDPWVPGNRANEQGFAFENYVFGGVVVPPRLSIIPMSAAFAEGLQSVAAPLGFQTSRQWDVWWCNGHMPPFAVMDQDRKDDEDWPDDRLYPVPQAWTQWLFSDELWTDHIHRYGLQAVKVPKLQAWEIRSHDTGELGWNRTGEDRWNTGKKRKWTQNWD
ncbi:hypothetical protein KCU98_g5854, partial [Aureobasidium melanogenum]